MKKKKSNVIPIFEEYVRKNPPIEKPLFGEPRRWEDILDEDQYWYEEEPMFDDNGNYIGMKKNIYVIFKRVIGWRRRYPKSKNNSKPLFELNSKKGRMI